MDSLTFSHSKQYTFIHIKVTVWKLQRSRFPKFVGLTLGGIDTPIREINSQYIIQMMEEGKKRKKKKKREEGSKRIS